MTYKPTLVDHVRETIRLRYAYPGRAERFLLKQIYAIADADADQYPGHLNQEVRHAVMRQMIQDERKPMDLTFVKAGVYHYPMIMKMDPETGKPITRPKELGDEGSGFVPDGVTEFQDSPARERGTELSDERAESERRRVAAHNVGETEYERICPCKNCGGHTCYVCSRACKRCAIARAQARWWRLNPAKPAKPAKPRKPRGRPRESLMTRLRRLDMIENAE